MVQTTSLCFENKGLFSNHYLENQLLKLDEWKKKDVNIVMQEINNMLFAHRINLQGNALGDQFGTTIIVRNVQLADIDIEKESERLSQGLEEL